MSFFEDKRETSTCHVLVGTGKRNLLVMLNMFIL